MHVRAVWAILALAGALQALGALHVPVIRAMGAVYREAWRRAVYFALLTAGVWFASRWGLAGVAAAVVAAWVVLHGLLAHLALGLLGTRWTALLGRLVPALWTGFWSTAAVWLAAGEVRAASLPPVAALALELAVWGAAATAATWFARPAFPHWALAQLPFDAMGRAGDRLRAALSCLARRWPTSARSSASSAGSPAGPSRTAHSRIPGTRSGR